MPSLLIGFGIYGLGCVAAMLFFMFGSVPALNERNWRWPVVFFWPLLAFWPLYALTGCFIKAKGHKQKPAGR